MVRYSSKLAGAIQGDHRHTSSLENRLRDRENKATVVDYQNLVLAARWVAEHTLPSLESRLPSGSLSWPACGSVNDMGGFRFAWRFEFASMFKLPVRSGPTHDNVDGLDTLSARSSCVSVPYRRTSESTNQGKRDELPDPKRDRATLYGDPLQEVVLGT